MLVLLVIAALMLSACTTIEVNTSEMMPDQMLERSTHVFVGVIQKEELLGRLISRVTGQQEVPWRAARRRVQVEMVLRGDEPRKLIDIYEAVPMSGFNGDFNITQEGGRYLFLLRLEGGRYHVVRDFYRSIYPIYSGSHNRLPGDGSVPFWERFALLQWWVQPDYSRGFGAIAHTDPGAAFSRWRLAKVLRGLFRHPDLQVRLAACEDLLHMSAAQDECWNALPLADRQKLNRFWNVVPAQTAWEQNRRFERDVDRMWKWALDSFGWSSSYIDELRLFTTISNRELRQKFCRQFRERFPDDRDNGCPADQPPPASIVTQDGEVPLPGPWPMP